ncbi:MAG: DUF2125 domain-containing protein [Alphaproteobacteria bacterium]|nr:DUF2125 domain-containing protein [Alphaproteobacteria bacterium]
MNELTPPPVKKSRTHKILIAVVLSLLGVAGLGYYASRAGLDKAVVEQQLNAWIEQTEKQAKEQGQSIDIRYGDVAIKGGLADGHALISNIEVINTTTQEKNRVTVEQMRLEPHSADLSEVSITFLTPIHVFEGNNRFESASLVSEPPLAFTVEKTEHDGEGFTRITNHFSQKTTLRFLVGQDASGEEEETQTLTPRYDTIDVSMSEGSRGVVTTHESRPDLGSSELRIKNLKIVPVGNEVGTITVDSITSDWKNSLNDEKINVVEISSSLKNLSANEKFLPFAPVNAALKLRFEGAMPQSPEALAAMQSAQTSLKLDEFSLSTKDATISATADFVANKEDILPVGMANISIGNVQSWRKILKQHKVLRKKDEPLINTLFIRVAGQTLPDAKDVSIDIQRAREGAFQIGGITFEELLAILLGNIKTPLDTKLPEPTAQAAPVDAVKAE